MSDAKEIAVTTMSGMDIKDFLLARITEDQAAVAYPAEHERPGGYSYADVGGPSDVLTVGTDRVLAECAAKRAIIEIADRVETMDYQITSEWGGGLDGAGDDILKSLATVYAEHPDYREDWRP